MKEKISQEGDFMIFCTELYKNEKNLNGVQVKDLFIKYKVWDFLYENFDYLNIFGEKYIIEDMDSYIKEQKTEEKSPKLSL